MRYFCSIPFGAKNITTDIKYECGFKESLAENIKLAYGACLPDRLQSLSEKVLRINDEETGLYDDLSIRHLSEIITCRIDEILDADLSERKRQGIQSLRLFLRRNCRSDARLEAQIQLVPDDRLCAPCAIESADACFGQRGAMKSGCST